MTWWALIFGGVAVADLARSAWPGRSFAAPAAGGLFVVLAALMLGVHDRAVVLAVPILVLVVGWTLLTDRAARGGRAAWPLLWLGTGLGVAFIVPWPERSQLGAFQWWLDHSAPMVLVTRTPEAVLLMLAVGLMMLSTGNVLVRLILQASGTARPGEASTPASDLRGGRMLGPMERLFIYGLGLSGNFVAAGIVIAAKGLIRWPELQSKRGAHTGGGAESIDEVTEYFLVGSFLSWMIALAGVVLVAGQLSYST